MIYSIRKEGETSEKLILKYKKLFFQSRNAYKLKAERYVTKKPTRRKQREQAIVRTHYRNLSNKVYF